MEKAGAPFMRCCSTMLPWMSMTLTVTGTLACVAAASTRSATDLAVASKSIDRPFFRKAGETASARELAKVVAETVFDIAGLMETAGHQGLDARLRGGAAQRG